MGGSPVHDAGIFLDTGPGWSGWWGEDAPFHHHLVVPTHHDRPRRSTHGRLRTREEAAGGL